MSRKILVRTDRYPYHINARANNREPFPGEMEFIWKVLTDELYLQSITRDIQIHAFVLMPNHFHLLATFPEAEICQSMKEFLSSSTRIINTKNRRSGRIFGARYHWSVITTPLYYAHALKYVYRNPVKAKLCVDVSSYEFSSFTCLGGRGRLPIAIVPPLLGIDKYISTMTFGETEAWLNKAYGKEDSDGIRRALKRRVFRLPVGRKNRRPLPIEYEL